MQVTGLTGVKAIAAGNGHSLAVKNDGTVWAWGSNIYGELGDGTSGDFAYKNIPVQVKDLSGATQVSAGHWLSLAVANTVDAQAPTTTASTSPEPNPSGWNNQDVTLSFVATDNQGGWGVKEIRYQTTGAQTIPQTLYDPSNPPVISHEGTTEITYFAIDYAGNKEAPKTLTVRLDKSAPEAPVITSPANGSLAADGSFTIRGTAEANGTVEMFKVTTSGTRSIGTTSVSSSGIWSKTFSGVPNGSHTYEAKAKDAAGNTSGFSNTRTVIVDTIAPSVRRVVPIEDATGIAPATNVAAVFSEAMRETSINQSIFTLYKKGSTTAIRATVTYDAAKKRAVLDPSDKLQRGATYKAVLTTGAKDLAGNQLSKNKLWFFTISA